MQLKQWSEGQIEETMVYLRFLSERTKGSIPTGASFLRKFVTEHSGYKRDSIVTNEINYDLMQMLAGLNDPGNAARSQLLGGYA